jgi:hypothetical protein
MDWMAVARRRAFSIWLRTGRLPRWARPGSPEVKYNPWHDPVDGRFTFAGTGRYFGRGGATAPVARMAERPKEPKKDTHGGAGRGFTGGGAGASWTIPNANPKPSPSERARASRPDGAPGTSLARIESNHAKNWSRITWNGYQWWFDTHGRLREVEGTLTLSEAPRRSRAAQRRAGRPDRRASDDGGHIIAGRFNGPREAFNHFAQDRNFNRGAYRTLEDQWARALRAGKRVDVRIMPIYEGASRRPSYINVWFWIDGHLESQKFPNERQRRSNAKR